MIRLSALVLLAALLAAPGQAADAPLQGGVYADLMLGYDPATKTVTGYYDSGTGAPPVTFHCIFYLTGSLNGTTAKLRTYFPETPRDAIAGTLTVATPGQVTIALAQEHGGCANVQHFADKGEPADFTLDTAHSWIAVRVVRSKKAYFHDAPETDAHRRAYLVQGDGVGVKAAAKGWLEIDYPNHGDKTVSGWMPESEFYPAGSPP
jgi:hypothetical protein